MWTRTGTTIPSALAGVTLHTVMSDSGEGVGYDVVPRATTLGRVQEYIAMIEAGKSITHHGVTWSLTLPTGQVVFDFRTRDDAVRHAVDNWMWS